MGPKIRKSVDVADMQAPGGAGTGDSGVDPGGGLLPLASGPSPEIYS